MHSHMPLHAPHALQSAGVLTCTACTASMWRTDLQQADAAMHEHQPSSTAPDHHLTSPSSSGVLLLSSPSASPALLPPAPPGVAKLRPRQRRRLANRAPAPAAAHPTWGTTCSCCLDAAIGNQVHLNGSAEAPAAVAHAGAATCLTAASGPSPFRHAASLAPPLRANRRDEYLQSLGCAAHRGEASRSWAVAH